MKRRQFITNFIWRFAERCGVQGITFIVTIILARILAPEVFGIVALVNVFTNILNVFVDSGLGTALIQKKDADDLDFSTVFYCNVIVCCTLYAIMYFLAPYIALFYSDDTLSPVLRVLCLIIIISGLKNVQQAYVSRTMQFKKFFFSTLGGTIGAAIIGISMACLGYGVWSLVFFQVINTLVDTIILWITVKWRPKKLFSISRLKSLLSYGWKLLISALLDTIYNNVRQLIIGKLYSSSDLAFYNKGKYFPSAAVESVNSSIDSVMFPVISREQNNKDKVKEITRKVISTSSFVIWPIAMGLAACARPLVIILLTEKWLPCVVFMQIFCITYGFWPIHTANLNAIKAVGRSDIFLKLEIIKKCMGVLSILISMPFGVLPIAIAYLITSPISAVINAYPNKKLLGYTIKEQISDMLPSMVLAFVMASIVLAVGYININIYIKLVLQILTGVFIYVTGAKLLNFEEFNFLLSLIFKKKLK